MNISDVKIFPVGEDRLKAYVTVVVENAFVLRELKVIRGNRGLFVAMPSKKGRDGTFKDICHPLNQETRDYFEKTIIAAYRDKVGIPLKEGEQDGLAGQDPEAVGGDFPVEE